MFVRWSCGCVGLLLPDSQAVNHTVSVAPVKTCNIVIEPCDIDDCTKGFQPRFSLTGKGYTALPADKVERLVKALDVLIEDGYGMRDIRTALGISRG